MKKFSLIIGGIVLFVVIALIILPIFLKPTVVETIKSALNKRVSVKVEFEDINISLLKNFPKATVELKELTLIGKGEFEKDTLMAIQNTKAKMSLFSLFKRSERGIEEIILQQPELKLVVGKSKNVNWVITKVAEVISDDSGDSENKENSGGFSLQLKAVKIENANIRFIDRSVNMVQSFENANFKLNGEMYGNSTELKVDGGIEKMTINYNGIKYLSNVSVETKTLLNVNYEKMDIAIAENELMINGLPMELGGMIQIPSDSMFFDLEVKTKHSDFTNFLALVPVNYEKYLTDVETKGSASVSGAITGLYFEEIYPEVDFKVDIKNGELKYTNLPEAVSNIEADISFFKPEGELDLAEMKIENAHFEVGKNPVDFTLFTNKLFSDPYFDGAFVGKINFDELKKALPLDSANVSGTIDANLFAKGNYSAIENEEYELIQSDGIVLLDNFIYDSPELTRKIYIPTGQLNFSPGNVTLSKLNIKVGQSSFNLTGKVTNHLNYLLKEGVLKGDMQLSSSFVNLNELLRLQKRKEYSSNSDNSQKTEQTTEQEADISEKLVFDIPENIDLTFRSNIKNAVLDKIDITNIVGVITAQKGKLMLNGLHMNMFNGMLDLTGSYQNSPQNQPFVDFGLDVSKFDIPVAFRSLSGLQRMIPVGSQSQGTFSTSLKMNGRMSEDFKIITRSVNGNGNFSTENMVITNSPVFQQLNGILRPEKLQNVAIDDFTANFQIVDGNIDLKPFETRVAGQETSVSGTLSADNLLEMRLDFNVEREAFGRDIQNILSAIPGNQKLTVLPAGVEIKGPVNNPQIKIDLSETQKVVTNAAKSELKNSLDQLGKGLKKLFK